MFTSSPSQRSLRCFILTTGCLDGVFAIAGLSPTYIN